MNEEMNEEEIAREAFESFKPLYPNYIHFLRKVKQETNNEFMKKNREFLMNFYKNQEIVQIFQPAPLQDALRRKEGYYSKIIAFYPFERLYTDTGKILIYPFSLKEARARPPAPPRPPPAPAKPIPEGNDEFIVYKGVLIPRVRYQGKDKKEVTEEEYLKNLGQEKKYPPELRHVYLRSGKKKSGTQEYNKMSEELKQRRKEFLENK